MNGENLTEEKLDTKKKPVSIEKTAIIVIICLGKLLYQIWDTGLPEYLLSDSKSYENPYVKSMKEYLDSSRNNYLKEEMPKVNSTKKSVKLGEVKSCNYIMPKIENPVVKSLNPEIATVELSDKQDTGYNTQYYSYYYNIIGVGIGETEVYLMSSDTNIKYETVYVTVTK